MLQSKTGIWIAGACAAIVLVSIGYGMGRRAGSELAATSQALTPAGAPLPAIQIEPIQPHEEMAAISAGPAAADPTAGAAAPAALEGSARTREIQRALKMAGFDPGPMDGQMGQKTRTAIRDFQTAQGLEPDGKVGPRTWGKLEPYLSSHPSGEQQ